MHVTLCRLAADPCDESLGAAALSFDDDARCSGRGEWCHARECTFVHPTMQVSLVAFSSIFSANTKKVSWFDYAHHDTFKKFLYYCIASNAALKLSKG